MITVGFHCPFAVLFANDSTNLMTIQVLLRVVKSIIVVYELQHIVITSMTNKKGHDSDLMAFQQQQSHRSSWRTPRQQQ